MSYTIKSLKIKNFGIFKEKTFDFSHFNIIIGKNESGKTTILDAILTSLFKYPDKIFVDRKYEKKDVSILLCKDKEFMEMAPKDSTFLDNLGLPGKIPKKDYMIFRSLVMHGLSYSIDENRGNSSIFDSIKKNISGFDYEKLKRKIFENAQITPKTKDFDKNSKEKIDAIRSELNIIQSIKQKSQELSVKQKSKPKIETTLRQLEKLQEFSEQLLSYVNYKKLKLQREKITVLEKELESLSHLKIDYYTQWESKIKRHDDLVKEKFQISNEIEKHKFQINEIEKATKMTEDEMRVISSEIDKYESYKEKKNLYERLNEETRKTSFLLKISFITTIIFLILSALLIIKRLYLPSLITIFPLLYTIFIFTKNRTENGRIIDFIKNAERDGISLTSYGDKIVQLKENLNKLKRKFDESNEKSKILRVEINDKERALSNLNNELESNENEERKLISLTHCESVKELKEKLDKKKEVNMELNNEKRILKHLGSADAQKVDITDLKNMVSTVDIEQELHLLRMQINEYIDDVRKSKDMEELNELYSSIESLRKIIVDKANRYKNSFDEIIKIENDVKSYLRINNYGNRLDMDLKEIKLNTELKAIEDRRKAAILAAEAIDKTEKEFTENMDNAINIRMIQDYMRLITASNDLLVKMSNKTFSIVENGMQTDEDSLSSGTLVQLMFCVRIALAKRLFKDKKLFFFFDDTFLTFDDERKLNATKIVNSILQEGWQIFYFTIDREIVKLFKKEIREINEISL